MHEKVFQIHRGRVEKFLARLQREYYPQRVPLTAECARTTEPVAFADRLGLEYRPIREGEKWGETWDSSWFRIAVEVPADFAGKELCILLNLGGESQIFDAAGIPLYGLTGGTVFPGWMPTAYHKDRFVIGRDFRAGDTIEYWVEAAANQLFGVILEEEPRLDTPHPLGHLTAIAVEMQLAVFDREAWMLALDCQTLFSMLDTFGAADYRAMRILHALEKAIDVFGGDCRNAAGAREVLRPLLSQPAMASALEVYAVGHAHIDVGWLWPVRESRRKAARTFSSQLAMLDEYPEYKFGASQPVLYQFVKEDYPELYEKIRARVKDGRWELQGGMWVEADANITSGESLVRQFVHGKNFFRDEFGVEVKNLWIPDVFGYSASMPQIIRKAGCDFFLTQKISWSQINRFPHHTFRWGGVDGTEVVTHFPPENTYNSLLDAGGQIQAQDRFAENGYLDRFMCLYGIGDGGGPTEDFVERGLRQRDLEGCPKMRYEFASRFFELLAPRTPELPVWRGELYLELHRGTLTTQSRTKRGNRKCEQLLTALEFLASAAPAAAYPRRELDQAWKTLLTNQFHDILPGSSIRLVYETTEREHQEIQEFTRRAATQVAAVLFDADADAAVAVNTLGCAYFDALVMPAEWGPYAVMDAAGWELPSQLEEGRVVVQISIPANQALTLRRGAKLAEPSSVAAADLVLENELIRYEFTADGSVVRAYDKELGRDVLNGAGNVLSLYGDQPINWDAWDVDLTYPRDFRENARGVAARRVAAGKVRQVLEFDLAIGNSTLRQQVTLRAESKRLDFVSTANWHEAHKMLRVAFPTTVVADEAAFDIQYAHVKRSTHDNNSWELAQFEVCGQRYADLSDAEYGVALLNDCKYGYRVKDSTLDLNLLRSSKHPDFFADQGRHEFTYSLLPHAGALVDSQVMAESAMLNRAPWVFCGRAADGVLFPARLLTGEGISLEVVKRAEKDDSLILRVVELRGRNSAGSIELRGDVAAAAETDLLEWTAGAVLPIEEGLLHLQLKPFEIKTIRLTVK